MMNRQNGVAALLRMTAHQLFTNEALTAALRVLCLLPFLFLSGCSPTYVLQAGYEEAKILWSRRPIEEVLQRANLDNPTREKLQLVLRIRQFAERGLGLRVNGSYSSLAEVQQPPIAYVLTAAPQTRLEPY